jgi:sialic acid synthase SpsE/D-lyxose ketol-isomerase
MLYIFEMANNHMGDVNHAKKIINEFALLSKKWKIKSGIKLQLRNLETFIQPNFKNKNNLPYIKRFEETRLNTKQIKEIIDLTKYNNLLSIATPFDEESIDLINQFNIDIIKIASCSIDDWPLLERISKINKKIIISTAGAEMNVLEEVYQLFKKNKRNFAFMHCVGDYPTPTTSSNLQRISEIKNKFPDIEIGFSTHENPNKKSLVTYAIAMGCSIIEKHVGMKTKKYKLNDYSLTSRQMNKILIEIHEFNNILNKKSKTEKNTLKSLKRGVYIKQNLLRGHTLSDKDFYLAMPLQKNMLGAFDYHKIIGSILTRNKSADEPLNAGDIKEKTNKEEKFLKKIKNYLKKQIKKSKIAINEKDKIEISCPLGLENFFKIGCVLISKINDCYCKKYIILLPNQKHPPHKHMIKVESFELLHGDCELTLDNKKINLEIGLPQAIPIKKYHSFKSKKGCVIEEISTQQFQSDSTYKNNKINKIEQKNRKIKINLF